MNPKVEKLKAEYAKNARKISTLQTRNKKIEEVVTELENTDIIGIVRENNLTPDELAELIEMLKNNPVPNHTYEEEAEEHEEN